MIVNERESSAGTVAPSRFEIERKYVLTHLPELPAGTPAWELEQGYVDARVAVTTLDDADSTNEVRDGRIRRAVGPDREVVCTHTIKRGSGLVREETERSIDEEAFLRAWLRPDTLRLRKTRHKVRDGDLVWEVDVFADLDLLLAEVELPSADTEVTPPQWLVPCIDREVTGDESYTNYALARQIARASEML
jgi:CYTH domain-containing protein